MCACVGASELKRMFNQNKRFERKRELRRHKDVAPRATLVPWTGPERYRFFPRRFLKTPPPRSSIWPSFTCRIAEQSSSSVRNDFLAALENHAVLKTRGVPRS